MKRLRFILSLGLGMVRDCSFAGNQADREGNDVYTDSSSSTSATGHSP
ncbi:MAG: hypothetical protein H7A46_25130 [Verrucomicrobiales bacterium]|nr:hypothetical protein [Verrucomicrobiales bacterium]